MSESAAIPGGDPAPHAGRSWFGLFGRGGEAAEVARSAPPRIGLLGHCGTGNLGDEASIAAVLDNLTRRMPAAAVVGLSMDPDDTARRLGIPCAAMRRRVFPFRRAWSQAGPADGGAGWAGRAKESFRRIGPLFRAAKGLRRLVAPPALFFLELVFLMRSLLLLCELDTLVICGGGQLLDWGGPWGFPYTLFKWVLLARCANVKCVFLNSGAGPLDAPLSRWFVRRMLAMADYVSLRDRASGELLRSIGFRGPMKVVADAVWTLRRPGGRPRRRPSRPDAGLVIGVAPMAYGDASRHWIDDEGSYRRLIDGLAEFCGRMLARGHRISLFSSDIWFDSRAIADLEAAIRRDRPDLPGDRLSREAPETIDDIFAALARVDVYVTCRFHGVVFASLQNVPSIALAPHPKVTTLMRTLGLSDYCLDIGDCDADALTGRADRLFGEMAPTRARIGRRVARLRAQLELQFDDLFLPENGNRAGAHAGERGSR